MQIITKNEILVIRPEDAEAADIFLAADGDGGIKRDSANTKTRTPSNQSSSTKSKSQKRERDGSGKEKAKETFNKLAKGAKDIGLFDLLLNKVGLGQQQQYGPQDQYASPPPPPAEASKKMSTTTLVLIGVGVAAVVGAIIYSANKKK
jgi:hypothetical protein